MQEIILNLQRGKMNLRLLKILMQIDATSVVLSSYVLQKNRNQEEVNQSQNALQKMNDHRISNLYYRITKTQA